MVVAVVKKSRREEEWASMEDVEEWVDRMLLVNATAPDAKQLTAIKTMLELTMVNREWRFVEVMLQLTSSCVCVCWGFFHASIFTS